ncbi:MAG: homoserine kinase [Haliscomenobacter sp.]|nr:homoserine kinase [Haliscomenobacter sp.]MBK8654987.1 homoserine kinase [Haliscomenobacter sp.]MBP9076330.1 homoserine kinase [Haliscomenobacter sp.]MBP9873909.1 homoserine kinase [Haliscomenobacter sp.]
MGSSGIKVFAPASVANVAVGYDILGFALEKPGDEIIASFKDSPGLEITKITGAGGKLPYDLDRNTAGFAAKKLLEYLGETERGIALEIHKKMPFGSGLGSSAASAAAGVMAVNELLGRPLEKPQLLPFAVLGEQIADGAYHADNVAPSLLGGIVLIRSNADLDVHRLHVPKGLYVAVIYPEVEVLTREARSILSKQVNLDQLIRQSGNLAGFIVGLYNTDFDLIRRSLEDVVIEPQRARLIPHFYEVKEAALRAGALGCSISGAGPSIFALCDNTLTAEAAGKQMQAVFDQSRIKNHLFLSAINQEGAVLL